MYYDLTKKEYTKYEKEFKKTYIGRKYFLSYLISYIFASFFFLGINVWILLDPNIISTSEIGQLACILVMVSFLIGGTVIWTHYMGELKGYIISKIKK